MSDTATEEPQAIPAPSVNGSPRLIDRGIFGWDCHGVYKRSDPMVIQREMAETATALDFDPSAAVTDLRVASADLTSATDSEQRGDQLAAFRAYGNLAAMTKAGFGLKGIDEDEENGWTESELLSLLERFWLWCENLKKNVAGSPS